MSCKGCNYEINVEGKPVSYVPDSKFFLFKNYKSFLRHLSKLCLQIFPIQSVDIW